MYRGSRTGPRSTEVAHVVCSLPPSLGTCITELLKHQRHPAPAFLFNKSFYAGTPASEITRLPQSRRQGTSGRQRAPVQVPDGISSLGCGVLSQDVPCWNVPLTANQKALAAGKPNYSRERAGQDRGNEI